MSLLDAIGQGFGYAGDVEQKFGGRAIRGALAGKPRELLSPIPFSDTLGITDPHQATSGSELATKLGVNHPLANAAAGFGIDVATDPLSWIGGPAAGRAAAKIPEAFADAKAASAARGLGSFGTYGDLKRVREAVPFVKNAGGAGERVVGSGGYEGVENLLPSYSNIWKATAEKARPGTRQLGASWPLSAKQGVPGFGFSTEAGGTPTAMHELYGHLVPDYAAATGNSGALRRMPLAWASEKLGQLGGGQNKGIAEGLSTILGEMHGHALENRKLPGGYLRGATDFLFSPKAHQLYDAQIAHRSPWAADAFHAAPGAILGGAAGTAAGAEGGYEEGGAPGGFAGALMGGLGGAALGGLASGHLLTPESAFAKAQKVGPKSALGSEVGAMRAIPPNPIDIRARKALRGANWEMASGAPERFSTDPVRSAYYAGDRQVRYAQLMGAPKPTVEKMRSALMERLKAGLGGEQSSITYPEWAKKRASSRTLPMGAEDFPSRREVEKVFANQEAPLSKLGYLANSANVDVRPLPAVPAFERLKTDRANYSPMTKQVLPNLSKASLAGSIQEGEGLRDISNFEAWSNPGLFAPLNERVPGWVVGGAEPTADIRTPVHEISHALHHSANEPWNPRYSESLYQKLPGWDSAKYHHYLSQGFDPKQAMNEMWMDSAPMDWIRKNISTYGTTNPSEFVAETGTKRFLTGNPLEQVLSNPKALDLYKALGGPKAHPELEAAIRVLLGQR